VAKGDRPNIPRAVPDADIRSLPIGPLEGFVLTRMDGQLDVAAIADMTGQSTEGVREAVERLVSLGAAEWVDAVHGGPKPAPEPAPEPEEAGFGTADTVPPPPADDAHTASAATEPPPQGEDAPGLEVRRDEPAMEDDSAKEEPVDLPVERRKRILDTYSQLEALDYYALLGVSRDAPKDEIRAAYFRLSKVFHPDTMFGKNLGSFKPKMEKVFQCLTEAYETLGRKKKREAYDGYLGMRETTQAVEQRIVETHEQAEAIERASATDAGRQDAPASPRPPPPSPSGRPSPEAVRRQLFGRRLSAAVTGGQSMPPRAAPPAGAAGPSMPPTTLRPPGEARREVLQGLARSLMQSSQHTGRQDELRASLVEADRAEAAGDLTEAANALRLARALAPDDPEIRARYDDVHRRLARSLVENYRRQAIYEEEIGRWEAAVLSWLRVIEGQPEGADPHRRAALALVQSAGDLRQAKDLAQRAVDLEPNNPRNRVVLGQVYRAAGMRLNALREVQEAAKLDPDDDIVKNLLRELGS
jgi:curved DNA-binding protein CbpA